MPEARRIRLDLSAGLASVAVALVLVALKFWALQVTGSLAVAASLVDSAMDLAMSFGALVAIWYAARPPDEDHAFGHTSAEDLAALGQSAVILAAALAIAWSAVSRLTGPEPAQLGAEGFGIVIMVLSILLTLGLVWWQGRVARRTGNRVVQADRLHYIGDLLPGIGAIVALWLSGRFGIGWFDSIVALAAAGYLAFGAARIGKGAWDALMDRSADPEIVAGIADMVARWPGVLGYHDLKTRTAGSRVFVNVHIELEGGLTLREAHDIGAGLRAAIIAAYPQADVMIHKDVAYETSPAGNPTSAGARGD